MHTALVMGGFQVRYTNSSPFPSTPFPFLLHRCHSDMSVLIPKTLVIWASLTLTLTQIAKVIWEGDAHITRVLGMGIFISLWHSPAGHLKLAHSIWSYYTSPVPRNLSVISFSLCLLHFPLERNEISREQLPYFHIRAIYDGPIDLMLEAKRCVQELWWKDLDSRSRLTVIVRFRLATSQIRKWSHKNCQK